MTNEEARAFIDTITGVAFANKAMLACLIAGKPVTVENCVLAAGPWLRPESPNFDRFVLSIRKHVEEAIAADERLSPSASWN